MFGSDAAAAAQKELERIESETGVATTVKTVEALGGETIGEAAERLARASAPPGIFTLIARKETKIEILVARRFQRALPRARRDKIQGAFISAFRRRDFDGGLERGVAAIAGALGEARNAGELPPPSTLHFAGLPPWSRAESHGGLILRNQVRLTLAGARAIVAGAEAKARAMQMNVNIAVVDDGGHLLAFERMDGARPASVYTAITKATTAATIRQPTGPLPAGSATPDPLLNLSLQNAAQASGGKITTLYGGVPVVVDGQVAGGVGVGGGTGEQDAQIARAGVQAFMVQLPAAPADSSKPLPAEKPD
jgi:glc operon protein GlcG